MPESEGLGEGCGHSRCYACCRLSQRAVCVAEWLPIISAAWQKWRWAKVSVHSSPPSRRWRAAQEAGLGEVPVIIRSASDRDVLELSLIENLQRADLNPIEEAQGYARLAGEFGMRQEEIAQKVGRSRAAVANAMRLLDLHEQVQTWLTQDLISVGHAKVLLALKAPEEQLAVAETVLRRSATVRATERLVARQLGQ